MQLAGGTMLVIMPSEAGNSGNPSCRKGRLGNPMNGRGQGEKRLWASKRPDD
jgi:hypothetical protein